ncbi:MAG: AtpZ/AtpI family protein [Vulcanimicrobiaceae bacterium]
MKEVLPLLGAGASFATTTVIGLLVGIWISRTTGGQLWVLVGLFAGLLIGGYAAYRLVARSLQ